MQGGTTGMRDAGSLSRANERVPVCIGEKDTDKDKLTSKTFPQLYLSFPLHLLLFVHLLMQ